MDHLYNLKNVKNTHWGLLLLVKLKADVCNCTKNNVPPWVFFTFLNFKNFAKLRKTSQIYNVELGKAFYIDIGFGVFLNGKWTFFSFCEIVEMNKIKIARGVQLEKVFLEISQNSQENTCARVSFLIKNRSGTCVFLWILLNF